MFAKSNNSSKTKGLKSDKRTQTNIKKISKNLCSAYVFKGCVGAIGDIFISRNIFLNELKL